MMFRSALIASLALATGAVAAELSEKFAKRLELADAAYQTAAMKADNVHFYALQSAASDRLKVLKTALVDATKAGDFDAATEIKKRLTEAETVTVPDPTEAKRGRPVFLTALYGVNQSWTDVTDQMNKLARDNKPIRLIVSDAVFADPAPTFAGGNSFVARYVLNGKVHVVSEFTGRELVIAAR